MYRVQIASHEGDRFERELGEGDVLIGRIDECDLVLQDPYIGRQHASLHLSATSASVEDLGSANGTLVNGNRVESETALEDGDVIRLGDTELILRRVDAEPQSESIPTAEAEGVTMVRPVGELLAPRPETAEAKAEHAEAVRYYARRLKLLHEVHQALAGSIELNELLNLILNGVFTHLKPEGAAILLGDGTEDGEVQVAASRSAEGYGDDPMVSQTLVAEVMGKQQVAIAVDTQTDSRFAQAGSIVASGARSLIAAPMVDSDGCLGMIVAHSKLKRRNFGDEDMELLASLAGAAALRIRNVGLAEAAVEREKLQAELMLARRLQESILPKELPEVDGYEVFGGNIPSRGVSGDYYRIGVRDEGREIVLGVADVCGKGMGASLIAATLEAVWSLVIDEGASPAEVFGRANSFLYQRTPPDKFATAFLAVVDVERGLMRYVNGAHNPPLLIRANGEYQELRATGFAQAMVPDAEYEEPTLQLEPGDLLVCFTDGIVEAANPDDEQFGDDRLVEVCLTNMDGTTAELDQALRRAMKNFTQGVPYLDDRTLVLLRRKAG